MGNMATPSGDLYALGIIGYDALCGHPPLTRDCRRAHGRA